METVKLKNRVKLLMLITYGQIMEYYNVQIVIQLANLVNRQRPHAPNAPTQNICNQMVAV